MFKIFPREERFFDQFEQISKLMVSSAEVFLDCANNPHTSLEKSKQIKDLEHQADEVTHFTVALLHKTFITPLDRDDIHELISKLDDIIDFIDAAAQRFVLYGITETRQDVISLAKIIYESCVLVAGAVKALENLKNPEELLSTCIKINKLENEADTVLRASVAQMFKSEPDVRKLIMFKEITELLETVTDRCEDVANVIEGIVLEYS